MTKPLVWTQAPLSQPGYTAAGNMTVLLVTGAGSACSSRWYASSVCKMLALPFMDHRTTPALAFAWIS
jgi:hypothetical protein